MADTTTVEAPVLDFEEMSWGDSKQIMILGEKLKKSTGDDTMALFTELETFIAPYIVSIPRPWLVKRAPDPLDLKQPGILEYLKRARFYDLLNLIMAEIAKVESEAGESQPPLK